MQGIATHRLDGIESLRAYAAIAVIMFHLVLSGGATPPDVISFVGTHFGMGVPLFFAVSGFGLAFGYMSKLNSRDDIKQYYRRRFARIAPLFYAALVFQLFYLWLGYGITFSPLDVILNATFVFNLTPFMVDGIVPASWTIGVEMIFYAILPALLLACTNLLRSVAFLVLSMAIAAQFSIDMIHAGEFVPAFVHHNFVKNFPFFLSGIACFHAYFLLHRAFPNHRRQAGYIVLAASFGLIGLLYNHITFYMYLNSLNLRPLWDVLWGIPFGLLCIGVALHPTRLLSNPGTRFVGKISFSVYIIHANILYKLGEVGFYRWIYQSLPVWAAYTASLLASLAIILAISTVTFRFIEQPGMKWGRKV